MSSHPRPSVALLITDLDNTLWDWFEAWHASFAPMLARLSERSGIPQEHLEIEIRAIHQKMRTSEYSLLLAELPSLRRLHGEGVDLLREYDDVLHVLNSARKRNTRLYPTVLETLRRVRSSGVPIVAYTESIAFWTEWRIKHVGLDGVLDVLYSSPDHDWPAGVSAADVRTKPAEEYGLKDTDHRHVRGSITKPDDAVLKDILENQKVRPDQAVYVGDSLTKDVLMAQRAGVLDVHARYGVSDGRAEYGLLRRVSHWPDDAIAREKAVAEGLDVVVPTYTIDAFDELLQLFNFQGRSDLM
jgi:FMN phosphatase YigB (HAD superfamily)